MDKILYKPFPIDYDKDLGDSGKVPYTRGIYANMYSGKRFTMRQLTGFGSPEDTNKRIKYMLDNGGTGLNVLFDFPTIQMYDSDDNVSKGHVGLSGVCVDSIEDMDSIFKDIKIDEISVSLVTHYPTNTSILFAMFLAMAKERGIDWSRLRGSVQNDITMEEVVRCGSEFISPKNCFRIQCDNVEFIRNNVPKWNPITFNGYNLRECGTSIVTETAVAMINGIETMREMIRRGHDAPQISRRLAFFWSIGNNFFEEIARLRAARRIWYRFMRDIFNIKESDSQLMRCHTQTSGISLTKDEPLNNIIRASFQALSSILGGTQSLHVDSYDEAYSVPSEESALISLRTQQIIQEETNITNVIDPLGGSYYIETLTNEIEKKILEDISKIEKAGGYLMWIESGALKEEISSYAYQHQLQIEDGTINIVGVNKYISNKSTSLSPFKYPDGVEERQIEKLVKLRKNRDNGRAYETLFKLGDACKKNINIFPYCIECAQARCTEGEMFKVIKEAFRLWNNK